MQSEWTHTYGLRDPREIQLPVQVLANVLRRTVNDALFTWLVRTALSASPQPSPPCILDIRKKPNVLSKRLARTARGPAKNTGR
jgi:hypothetical protein